MIYENGDFNKNIINEWRKLISHVPKYLHNK